MTFIQFLKELEQKLKGSNSYSMTKKQVRSLQSMNLKDNNINFVKCLLFDTINNDTINQKSDPLNLQNEWSEIFPNSNLKFFMN